MMWFVVVLRRYAVFDGRAHRTEFWMFVLWSAVVSLALTVLDLALGLYGDYGGPISGVYSLAILIPSLAVGSRRLHDIGRSGWWQLIGLIPLVGLVILIVWWARRGDPQPNEHGPEPWTQPQPV